MANIDVNPFGPNGALPSGYPIADNCDTDRADQALSARQGMYLNEKMNFFTESSEEIDETEYTQQRWLINSSNKWVQLSGSDKGQCVIIPIPYGTVRITLEVTEDDTRTFAFLKTNDRTAGATPIFSARYQTRLSISQEDGETVFVVSGDMNYLYIATQTTTGADKRGDLEITFHKIINILSKKDIVNNFTDGGVDKVLSAEMGKVLYGMVGGSTKDDVARGLAAVLGNPLLLLNQPVDNEGNEIPQTLQVLNAYRKAKQLSEIEWTPKSTVPNNISGTFPSGVKVTGLPYSSVKELDKFVGYNVSLHTFMTAVNNPYSLFYTERVSAANSTSAWGKTYHGQNCELYYGMTCSFLSSLCAGSKMPISVSMSKWAAENALIFAKVYLQNVDGVQIGDIYWNPDHDRIVTGIKRDSSGKVTNIVMTEAWQPLVRELSKTASGFMSLMASEHAIIYRHLHLYKNVDYVPSEFVAVDDEVLTPYVYNNDICCFAGDKACFREGDTIAINYNLSSVGAWTAMELYKGDTLLDTITIDSSVHVVDLTSMNLTYGKYKARMTDGENYSDYTYFEVLQTTVTASKDGNFLSMTFSSSNGTPIYFKVCVQSGSVRAMREFSPEELSNGEIICDIDELNKLQVPDNPLSGATLYAKVYFQGEYGQVTNEPILIQGE